MMTTATVSLAAILWTKQLILKVQKIDHFTFLSDNVSHIIPIYHWMHLAQDGDQ
jgi:hypothetical protein